MRFLLGICLALGICSSAWAQSYPSPQLFQAPVNMSLGAATASSQLTISVLDPAGNTPSTSHPVLVPFAGGQNGANLFGAITGAAAFTLATTSSMGCTTAVACRLWVSVICQTITSSKCTSILVGASLQSTASSTAASCFPLNEAVVQSTGSGTTGGTAIGTIFTSVSSLSNKAIRIVGYVEATWTSGTGWSSPSAVQLLTFGMHRPCERIAGPFEGTNSANMSLSTSTSFQASNLTFSPTLSSGLNLVRMRADVNVTCASSTLFAQWSRGTSPTLIGEQSAATYGAGALQYGATPVFAVDIPGSTTPSYTLYVKQSVSSACSVNNQSGNVSGWEWEEIMGALEPANDNDDLALRRAG